MTLWTAADGGGVGGMWTPAYPGELPETKENTNSVPPGGGEDWNPADEFNWFYGNGQFHISEDHELDELSSHAGVRADHTGPVAMGTVHVDMGKAIWNVNGNVSAHGVARILKDYTDHAGWQWGGMTDTSGEPVDTGSEFAPKKSYYFEYDEGIAKLAQKKSSLNFCSGAVHIGGKEGFLYTTEEGAMDALAEWAADTGIVLIAGNDSGLKRIEDLEIDNNGGIFQNPDEHLEQNSPDWRQPAGVFKCPACSRLFPTWGLYLRHRTQEEPMGENHDDPTKDTAWLDMDATFPPHYDEMPTFHEAAGAPEGKDLVAAPVPFIYDIEDDSITVGKPGTRQSDIPGQFTPGGIVEGTYEPGGKVHIRSMTNMPYTVRHMLELWYFNYPHMEIKSVDLTDDAGKQTKLAGKDIGGYIKSLVAADPATFHAWKALEAKGGKVFVVGGAVRDALLGKSPNDLDLMVTGIPADDVHKILSALDGRMDVTGKDFGVFRYKEGQHEVEIALPRKERSTGEGHKDFMVDTDHNMTPEEDLYRRDFTINAMAVDLDTGQLIDPFGGLADAQSRTLRTLHTKSLADDPLRTMRALTAVAKHGVIPNSETEDQIVENGPLLQHLPNDRIRAELDKMFGYDDSGKHKDVDTAKAMRLAMDTSLMKYMIPEVYATQDYDQKNPHHEQLLDQHLLSVLENVQKKAPNDPDLKLAGLLHDIGKPASRWSECQDCFHAHPGEATVCENCGGNNVSGHFYQKAPGIGGSHENLGAEMAAARMKELRYPNDRTKRVSELVQHHMFPAFNTEKGARRFLNKVGDHADDLLTLRWADQGGKSEYPSDPSISVDDHQKLVNTMRAGNAPTQLSQLAVNGRDLIAAGVPQGPQIGQTLQFLQEQVLENPQLNTRDALLGLVRARTAGWRDEPEWNEQFDKNYGQFSRTHPEGHRLNWTPGQWGKGILYDGQVHTYNLAEDYYDGLPAHGDYEQRVLGAEQPYDFADANRFHIHPDGYLGYYGTYDRRGMPFPGADKVMEVEPQTHIDAGSHPVEEEEEEDDWT